jgi:hypothetical protein
MWKSSRGKNRFSLEKRVGAAEDWASRKLMALVHWVAVMVAGHWVGVMVVVLEVVPEGVSEMVLVSV